MNMTDMSGGTIVVAVGLLITWVGAYIKIREYKTSEINRQRSEDSHLEELIRKVCTEFTNSDAYQLRRDRAVLTLAQAVVDEAFRVRAESFVDAKVDRERREQMERRVAKLEDTLLSLRADLGKDFEEAACRIVDRVRGEG